MKVTLKGRALPLLFLRLGLRGLGDFKFGWVGWGPVLGASLFILQVNGVAEVKAIGAVFMMFSITNLKLCLSTPNNHLDGVSTWSEQIDFNIHVSNIKMGRRSNLSIKLQGFTYLISNKRETYKISRGRDINSHWDYR